MGEERNKEGKGTGEREGGDGRIKKTKGIRGIREGKKCKKEGIQEREKGREGKGREEGKEGRKRKEVRGNRYLQHRPVHCPSLFIFQPRPLKQS